MKNIYDILGYTPDNPNIINKNKNYYLLKNFKLYKPYQEGIISDAMNTASNGIRDGIQMAGKGIKALWELIKNILRSMGDMLKQAMISLGDNQKRMGEILYELKKYDETTGRTKFEDYPDKEGTVDMYTVAAMNEAGWNLDADLTKNMDNNSMTGRIATVSQFFNTLTKIRTGEDSESELLKVTNEETLYNSLESMYQAAKDTFKNNADFTRFTQWNRVTNRVTQMRKPIFGNYEYAKLTPHTYGSYVAQAFSPAGAFVSTDKNESFNGRKARVTDFKDNITPRIVKDIPLQNAFEEVKLAIRYLTILITNLYRLNVIDSLKVKTQKTNNLFKVVDRLNKLTDKQVRDQMTKKNQAAYYDKVKNSTGESFNEIMDFLYEQGYGEAPDLTSNDVISDAKQSMNNQGLKSKTATEFNTQINDTFNQTVNKTGNFIDSKVKLKDTQVNSAMVKYGLEYLSSYLQQSAQLTFQEAKFFNSMTKIICDVATDTLKISKDMWEEVRDEVAPEKGAIQFGADTSPAEKEKSQVKDAPDSRISVDKGGK